MGLLIDTAQSKLIMRTGNPKNKLDAAIENSWCIHKSGEEADLYSPRGFLDNSRVYNLLET